MKNVQTSIGCISVVRPSAQSCEPNRLGYNGGITKLIATFPAVILWSLIRAIGEASLQESEDVHLERYHFLNLNDTRIAIRQRSGWFSNPSVLRTWTDFATACFGSGKS